MYISKLEAGQNPLVSVTMSNNTLTAHASLSQQMLLERCPRKETMIRLG